MTGPDFETLRRTYDEAGGGNAGLRAVADMVREAAPVEWTKQEAAACVARADKAEAEAKRLTKALEHIKAMRPDPNDVPRTFAARVAAVVETALGQVEP